MNESYNENVTEQNLKNIRVQIRKSKYQMLTVILVVQTEDDGEIGRNLNLLFRQSVTILSFKVAHLEHSHGSVVNRLKKEQSSLV